ncbi:MAG: phosphoenolpyruvate--protein phosphotransferase, partial [Firmicutes bacterium]|nr:phosphoenolpyruvate--protein phosphotransferase [Bacillota bacterium]
MHDLKGTIASPGIAMGKAMLVDERKKGVTRKKIDDAHAEIKKYHLALEDAEKVINGIKESYKDRI